jgi:hypothetical protein
VPENSWHKEIPNKQNYVGYCCEKLDGNCSLWEVAEIPIIDETIIDETTDDDTTDDVTEDDDIITDGDTTDLEENGDE